MSPQFRREEIKCSIYDAYLDKVPGGCVYKLDELRWAFGFNRVDGKVLALIQLTSGKTEEQISTVSLSQLHENIKEWCRENEILFYYDHEEDKYTFKQIATGKYLNEK